MIRRTRSLLGLLVALALVAAACGDGDGADLVSGTDPDRSSTTAPATTVPVTTTSLPAGSTTVFAVDAGGGGFIPVEAAMGQAPHLVILADGTVYRPGAVLAIYPGQALPAIETTTLSATEVQAVLALVAGQAGLFAGTDFGLPHVTDLPTTSVTAWLEGSTAVAAAYALDFEDAGGLTADQEQARAALTELVATVGSMVDAPGRDWVLAEPPALQVRSLPRYEQTEVDPGPARPFPFDADALAMDDHGFGCLDLHGADLATVLDAAADATQLTPWVVGDDTVQLVFRALYPHEAGCP